MRTGRTRISPLMIRASANARNPQGSPLSTTGPGVRHPIGGRMGNADERDFEIEALQDRLSRLSEASLRINDNLDFDGVNCRCD